MLLAVDLGIKTGLALYGRDGKLRWYRSQNFGSAGRLKRGARSLLRDLPELEALVLEGSGGMADVWKSAATSFELEVRTVSAERWREELLIPRERRGAKVAKATAGDLAREVIRWSEAKAPTSLRHDAAEAILVGLWACVERGWVELPNLSRAR